MRDMLLLGMLCPIVLFGFWLMHRADLFISRGGFLADETKEPAESSVAVKSGR